MQYCTKYGQQMIVPAGKYDLWMKPGGGKSQKLEEKLEVGPGKLVKVD